MPARGLARIPHTAYDANALVGGRDYVRIDSHTDIIRVRAGAHRIVLTYAGTAIATWWPDGTVSIMPERVGRDSAALRRIERVLPPDWSVDYRRGTAWRPRLLYRDAAPINLFGEVVFRTNGDIAFGMSSDAERITLADLDAEADHIAGLSPFEEDD